MGSPCPPEDYFKNRGSIPGGRDATVRVRPFCARTDRGPIPGLSPAPWPHGPWFDPARMLARPGPRSPKLNGLASRVGSPPQDAVQETVATAFTHPRSGRDLIAWSTPGSLRGRRDRGTGASAASLSISSSGTAPWKRMGWSRVSWGRGREPGLGAMFRAGRRSDPVRPWRAARRRRGQSGN